MDTYRDRLTQMFDSTIGSVVGCALDRLDRIVTHHEQMSAVKYYEERRAELDALPLPTRRDLVAEYVRQGIK